MIQTEGPSSSPATSAGDDVQLSLHSTLLMGIIALGCVLVCLLMEVHDVAQVHVVFKSILKTLFSPVNEIPSLRRELCGVTASSSHHHPVSSGSSVIFLCSCVLEMLEQFSGFNFRTISAEVGVPWLHNHVVEPDGNVTTIFSLNLLMEAFFKSRLTIQHPPHFSTYHTHRQHHVFSSCHLLPLGYSGVQCW